jgi:hypothetical protein
MSIIDPLDEPRWGVLEIGATVGIKGDPKTVKAKTGYLLRKRLLDASKVGRWWVSTPRRLLRPITGEASLSNQITEIESTAA